MKAGLDGIDGDALSGETRIDHRRGRGRVAVDLVGVEHRRGPGEQAGVRLVVIGIRIVGRDLDLLVEDHMRRLAAPADLAAGGGPLAVGPPDVGAVAASGRIDPQGQHVDPLIGLAGGPS